MTPEVISSINSVINLGLSGVLMIINVVLWRTLVKCHEDRVSDFQKLLEVQRAVILDRFKIEDDLLLKH